MARISPSCEQCLRDKQRALSADPAYLAEVDRLLRERDEADSAPLLVWRFRQAYERLVGEGGSFSEKKRSYNRLVLSMEEALRGRIASSADPLREALFLSRLGNYIDFGALGEVSEETFLGLFSDMRVSEADDQTYRSFLEELSGAERFLLIADNCGEIVLDRLLIEELRRRFPKLSAKVLVRGGEVLNDATREDALEAGIDRVAQIVDSGTAIAGTVPSALSPEAAGALSEADVILSKGQGNYESLTASGLHVFYLLLCKCDLFCTRFHVPLLTGVFVEEGAPSAAGD